MLKKLYLNITIFFHYLLRGLHSGDKLAFGPKEESLMGGVDINRNVEQDTLWDALLKGELTQEVKELRHETYYVSRAADNFIMNENGEIRKKNILDEDHPPIYDDNIYPLLLIQDNHLFSESMLDSFDNIENFNSSKYKSMIKFKQSFVPRFNLTEYLKRLVVKNIDSQKARLDLYFASDIKPFDNVHKFFIAELKRVENGFSHSEILDIDRIEFITHKAHGVEDMFHYEYNGLEYKGIALFDGNYVIQFNANKVDNGTDMMEKYYDAKKAEKYANKECKAIKARIFKCDVPLDTDLTDSDM